LLRDFQDALAIALGVRSRLAGGFWGGPLFHRIFLKPECPSGYLIK
jgi:hypothetical protein